MQPDDHHIRELARYYAAKHGSNAREILERYALINRQAAEDDAAAMWERVAAEVRRTSR